MTNPRSRARFGLALCLAGLMLAAPASGATYYLSNGGSDAASGTSPATPWATLAQANSRVAPGDVVVMAPGSYAGYPAPAVSGTAAARITYVGSLSAPGSVVVNGTSTGVTASHLTLKGLYLLNGFVLSGTRDSIAYCWVGGDLPHINGGMDCMVTHCTVSAAHFWFTGPGNVDTATVAMRDTLEDCAFVLNPTSGTTQTMRLSGIDSCVVNRCSFDITIGSGVTAGGILKMYYVRQCKFIDCRWEATNLRTESCDECGFVYFRDRTNRNLFLRDSIILHGPGTVTLFPNATGSWPGTTFSNTYDHCLFRVTGPNTVGSALWMQDAVQGDTYRYCTIVGADRGVYISSAVTNLTVDHCTVVGFKPSRGVFYTEDCGGRLWSGTNRITNNIFASVSPLRRAAGTSGVTSAYPAVFWNITSMAGRVNGDRNLYFTAMGADSAIMSGSSVWSRPGPGSAWNVASGADGDSRFGDPLFAETSSAASFSPRLRMGSPAIGAASDGSDLGAIPFAGDGDATPPGTVSDLSGATVDSTWVTLQWTSAGDDGFSGTAVACDLRWSTAPITAADFTLATAVNPAPVPLAGGTAASHTVVGLTPGNSYYFALRTLDDAGYWSGLSNVVEVTLPGRDVTPPARIGDLRFP